MMSMQGNPMFAALIVIVIAVLAMKALGNRKKGGYSFTSCPLMSAGEIRFFRVLQMAVPNELVFPQVNMAAVVRPDHQRSDARYMPAFRKVSQKRIDFVVCSRDSMAVRWLVELDDSSHDARRDGDRDAITTMAGYRTIRVRSARRYDIDGLRRRLSDEPIEPAQIVERGRS